MSYGEASVYFKTIANENKEIRDIVNAALQEKGLKPTTNLKEDLLRCLQQ